MLIFPCALALKLVSARMEDGVSKGVLVGDKIGTLVDENEDTTVGEMLIRLGIVVSTSVNKSEVKLVPAGIEDDVSRGMLVDNKTGMLVVVGVKVRKTDVSSPVVITVNVSIAMVVMVAVGSSNVVKDTEGVIITSVAKDLRIAKLENGIDIGRVVVSTTTNVLGNSDIEVDAMNEEGCH